MLYITIMVMFLTPSCCTTDDVILSDTLNFFRMSMFNQNGTFFHFRVWKTDPNEIHAKLWEIESYPQKTHCRINLSEEDWQQIKSVFENCNFWKMSPYARPYALEGNAYQIEACHNGLKHKVWRVNPEFAEEEKDFMEIALLIINLSSKKQSDVVLVEGNE